MYKRRYEVGGTDETWLLSFKLEQRDEWKKWITEIPYVQWPSDWKVKAVPPFGNAIIRYNIITPDAPFVSVYLDCYDEIGCVGEPYWEIYPNADGDCDRVMMNDVEGLLKAISGCRPKPEKKTE